MQSDLTEQNVCLNEQSETVVIGLSECQLALWVHDFVSGYGGDRIY